MASMAKRIEAALIREGLRGYVKAIDEDPATGEVVLWLGGVGLSVYGVRDALDVVREAAEADEEGAAWYPT